MPSKHFPQSNKAGKGIVVDDPRFAEIHTAPTFKKKKTRDSKISVDDRFRGMLEDSRFQAVPGNVDAYGRKLNQKAGQVASKELNHFYQIDNKSNSSLDNKKDTKVKDKALKGDKESRLDYLNKLSRGEIEDDDSDDSDGDELVEEGVEDGGSYDSESDASSEEEGISSLRQRGPLDIPLVPGEQQDEESDDEEGCATTRLAIQNCDWTNVRAVDLM